MVVSCEHEDDTQTLTATVVLTEDVGATHLEDGYKLYTATATIGSQTFTAEKRDVVEAEGHSWNYTSEDVTYTWAEDYSSCTAIVPCENCDETTTVAASEITHRTTTAANCHMAGVETYTATFETEGLGNEKTKDLGKDMSKHDGETEVRGAIEANCHTDGYTGDTYCLGCNNKISEGTVISKETIPHTPGTPTRENESAATCTKAATYDEVVRCTVCTAELSRTVRVEGTALGHSWGGWTVTKNATCTEDGSKTRTCGRDGSHTETVTIPKTGHVDENGDGVCDACGKQLNSGFRCSFCNTYEANRNKPLIGWIYIIIHFFIHLFAQMKAWV